MPNPTHKLITTLLRTNTQSKKLSIFEFGCGSGELLNVLNGSNLKYYQGTDLNADSISRAKEVHPSKKYQFFTNKPTQIAPHAGTKQFDAVINIGVLQYLSDKQINLLLKESKRILKSGGVVCISCATDHMIYRVLNLYQFFLPHRYINKKNLERKLVESGFSIMHSEEKGLLFTPVFSHMVILFFDAADKLIFNTKGQLGPIGTFMRKLTQPLTQLEYAIPINFGYTLFIVARKA
jgi:SAM-dependent methyltransferase